MSTEKILGSADTVETKISKEVSDKETVVIEVEGLYSDVSSARPCEFCPDGMEVMSSNVTSTGDGMGKLTIRCIKYDAGSSFSAIRSTIRITMESVNYDLEDHPYLRDSRDIILMWLATSESERVDDGDYKYADKNGVLQTIDDEGAEKFCDAYMAGIKNFNRYFPVIERISIWKNPPGLNHSGLSFASGQPDFSDNIGTFDNPPITLNGYPPSNWFKSGDGWQENANKTWTRTEQWTYTPEGSDGDHAWIYDEL